MLQFQVKRTFVIPEIVPFHRYALRPVLIVRPGLPGQHVVPRLSQRLGDRLHVRPVLLILFSASMVLDQSAGVHKLVLIGQKILQLPDFIADPFRNLRAAVRKLCLQVIDLLFQNSNGDGNILSQSFQFIYGGIYAVEVDGRAVKIAGRVHSVLHIPEQVLFIPVNVKLGIPGINILFIGKVENTPGPFFFLLLFVFLFRLRIAGFLAFLNLRNNRLDCIGVMLIEVVQLVLFAVHRLIQRSRKTLRRLFQAGYVIRICRQFFQFLVIFANRFQNLRAAVRQFRPLFHNFHIRIHGIKLSQGVQNPGPAHHLFHYPEPHKITDLGHQHIGVGKAGAFHFLILDVQFRVVVRHKAAEPLIVSIGVKGIARIFRISLKSLQTFFILCHGKKTIQLLQQMVIFTHHRASVEIRRHHRLRAVQLQPGHVHQDSRNRHRRHHH